MYSLTMRWQGDLELGVNSGISNTIGLGSVLQSTVTVIPRTNATYFSDSSLYFSFLWIKQSFNQCQFIVVDIRIIFRFVKLLTYCVPLLIKKIVKMLIKTLQTIRLKNQNIILKIIFDSY